MSIAERARSARAAWRQKRAKEAASLFSCSAGMDSVNIVVAAGSHSGALAALANTLDAAAIPYRTHRSPATLASVSPDGIFVCDVFDGPEFAALRDRGCRSGN